MKSFNLSALHPGDGFDVAGCEEAFRNCYLLSANDSAATVVGYENVDGAWKQFKTRWSAKTQVFVNNKQIEVAENAGVVEVVGNFSDKPPNNEVILEEPTVLAKKVVKKRKNAKSKLVQPWPEENFTIRDLIAAGWQGNSVRPHVAAAVAAGEISVVDKIRGVKGKPQNVYGRN